MGDAIRFLLVVRKVDGEIIDSIGYLSIGQSVTWLISCQLLSHSVNAQHPIRQYLSCHAFTGVAGAV
jgi:hypothetical protein